jgi:CheY-like chemotaxis protein
MTKILLVEDNEMNRDIALEAGCNDNDTKPVEWPRQFAKSESLLNGDQMVSDGIKTEKSKSHF